MSLSYYNYKLDKYKLKSEKHPDNLIYKKKYIYYINQIGGGLGWVVEGVLRVGALCRSEAMIRKDLVAKTSQMTGKQLFEETTNKLLNFTQKTKQAVKEAEKGTLEKVANGDIPVQFQSLDKLTVDDLTTSVKNMLIHYAENPACPMTSINITGKDENTVAKEIIQNVGKFADKLDKVVIPKVTTTVDKLSPAAIETIRKIYLTIND